MSRSVLPIMSEPSVRPVNLLLIADCPTQRELLRQAFGVCPTLAILAETNTKEALDYLTGAVAVPGTAGPDLVVINLPAAGETELSACFRLAETLRTNDQLRGIPLVMLADATTLAELPNPPGGWYFPILHKPSDPKALQKMAHHFGEYWGAVARIPVRPQTSAAAPPPAQSVRPAVVPWEDFAELPAQQYLEILVVDDNDDDATMFRESLEDVDGVRVMQILDNAEAALQYLRKQGPYAEARRPDMVVLDIHMPRKNGLTLLEEIQADSALRNLPIVMLTASRQEEDIWNAYSHGSCSFMEKPAKYEWLRELSVRFAAYWTLLAHLPPRQEG